MFLSDISAVVNKVEIKYFYIRVATTHDFPKLMSGHIGVSCVVECDRHVEHEILRHVS